MVTFNHDADDGDDDDDSVGDDGVDGENYNDECRFSFNLTMRTWSNTKVNGGINIDFHDGDHLDTGDNFDADDLVGHVQEGLGIHGGACSYSSEKTPFEFHFFV